MKREIRKDWQQKAAMPLIKGVTDISATFERRQNFPHRLRCEQSFTRREHGFEDIAEGSDCKPVDSETARDESDRTSNHAYSYTPSDQSSCRRVAVRGFARMNHVARLTGLACRGQNTWRCRRAGPTRRQS